MGFLSKTLGKASSLLFGSVSGGGITKAEQDLLDDERARSDALATEAEADRLKRETDKVDLAKRAKKMQGGGRVGLMFRGNRQGVA